MRQLLVSPAAVNDSISFKMSSDKDQAKQNPSKFVNPFQDMATEQPHQDSLEKKSSIKESAKKVIRKASKAVKWIWDDLKKPHLMWVKIIFLFQSASLVVLYPYLTIHMRSLGFTIEDTAVVNSAVPVADIFGPPLAGFLADKIGNFRIFMGIVTFLNGFSSLALLAVPMVSVNVGACCTNEACVPIDVETYQNLTSTMFEGQIRISCIHDGVTQRTFTELNESITCSANSTCTAMVSKGMDIWLESFSLYLSARVALDVLRASSLMLFEGAVVVIIKEHGGDYGLQKLFGTVGSVIFSPLAGIMIDAFSKRSGQEDYQSVIFLYFALRSITALLMLKLSLDFKPPAKKVFKDLRQVMMRFHVLSYLVVFMVAGLMWGFLETFLFWFLEDLGSSKFLMGLSMAVGTLAGVPITISSRLIVKKLGHKFIIIIALLLYAIRFGGYALISHPGYVLIFELAKPFCTTLLLISAFTFIKDFSPMSTAATVEGIFGSLYFGVGRGLGGLFGAYAWEALGAQLTFMTFSTASIFVAVTFFVSSLIAERRTKDKFILNEGQHKA